LPAADRSHRHRAPCCRASGSTGRSASGYSSVGRRTRCISVGSQRTVARTTVRSWSPCSGHRPRRREPEHERAQQRASSLPPPPATSGCSGTWTFASSSGRSSLTNRLGRRGLRVWAERSCR
jgi:hypothetical protein